MSRSIWRFAHGVWTAPQEGVVCVVAESDAGYFAAVYIPSEAVWHYVNAVPLATVGAAKRAATMYARALSSATANGAGE